MKRLAMTLIAVLCASMCYGQGTYALNASGATLNPAAATGIGMYPCVGFYFLPYDNLAGCTNPALQSTQGRRGNVGLSGTTTSATGIYPYDQIAANGMVGWTLNVLAHYTGSYTITGGAYSCTSTITSNTTGSQSSGGNGAQITFSPACPSAIVGGDLYTVTPPAGLNPTNTGWGIASGSGTLAYDTAAGHQMAAFSNLPAPTGCQQLTNSGTTVYQTLIDSGSVPNVIMNGVVTQSIMLSLQSGAVTVTMNAHRNGGQNYMSGSAAQTVTSGWHTYSATGSATETGTQAGNVIVIEYDFSGTGVVCMAGMFLSGGSTASGAHTHTNSSPYSDEFVADLGKGGYDGIRYNYTLGGANIPVCQTLDNLLQPSYIMQPCNASQQDYVDAALNSMSIPDVLALAKARGMHSVQIAIPWWFTTTEMSHLSDFLFGSTSTTYGAIRAAYGQTASYATVFSNITIAFGNETWNSSSTGQYTGPAPYYYPYFGLALQAATALKGTSSWNSTVGKFSVTVQAGYGAANAAARNAADPSGLLLDDVDSSNYFDMATTNCVQPTMFQNSVAEAYANVTNTSTVLYQSMNAGVPDTFYEAGPGAVSGNCSSSQLPGVFTGLGSGIIETLTPGLLQAKFSGLANHYYKWNVMPGNNVGYSSSLSSGGATQSELWGAWNNMRGTGANPDATVYASALLNQCAKLGNVYTPTTSGVPTSAIASSNGIPAETVPLVPALAYTDGGTNRCYIWWNLDASSHTVALTGADVLTGTITKGVYSSSAGALNDNNRTLNAAPVVTSSTSSATGATSYTLPAYSMLMLSGSTASTTTQFTLF